MSEKLFGKSEKNNAGIDAYEKLLALQEKQIRKLRCKVLRHSEKIKEAETLGEQMKDNVSLVMRPSTCKRRLADPTSKSLKKYSKKRRRRETFSISKLIHDGSFEDENQVLLGFIDTSTQRQLSNYEKMLTEHFD